MTISERLAAFTAYLLLPIGWLIVLLFHRRSTAVVFHCKQAVALVALVVVAFAAWVGIAWILTWIPYGAIVAVALFTLVMAVLIAAVVIWLLGMRNALAGQMKPLPLVGGWVDRFMP